ncbi:MAG: sigma-54-dependent Fis family transcriptional regulator [Saprospirales bacterium]|nr:MAG: sigma-54-dependent Fis family transcriptional regulator [Saprospirales bacterium]
MPDNYNLQSIKQRYGIVGRSEKLDQALSRALRVSKTELTVLIYGESGVGKEVFSKIIHDQSVRKHNNFIAINCGAIPEGTINSELFGHEKGSFTSATGERKGYFETVNGGTIFLDEVGEMPLDTQAYLLRVLETGEFIRVGSSQVLKTDVRVIAATNVDLKDKVARGKFREDLFYRLNTVPINIPPLRERKDDIFLLFRRFVIDFAERYRSKPIQLEEKAKILLEAYAWPGNIRELKNLAEQSSVLTDSDFLTAEDLVSIKPELLRRNLPAIAKFSADDDGMTEREMLFNVLFEMKKEVSDLKKFVLELVAINDLKVPSKGEMRALSEPISFPSQGPDHTSAIYSDSYGDELDRNEALSSIIIDEVNRRNRESEEAQEFEENLCLEDNEIQLIKKALNKHRGRRKDAALELGISERTLYRKIKQYDIDQ